MLEIQKKTQNIAILDDDELILKHSKKLIQDYSYANVYCLNKASNLYSLFKKVDIDLLLLDLKMPDIDGIKAIGMLADIEFSGSIIIFSAADAKTTQSVISFAQKSGINVIGRLSKPLLVKDIKKIITMPSQVTASNGFEDKKFSPEELRRAIIRGDIVPYYQPQIVQKNQQLSGFEVLARWLTSSGEVIPPIQFISCAEDNNLIDELTYSILRQSLNHLKKWLLTNQAITLSINISPKSVQNTKFPELLNSIFNELNINPQSVTLEVTESFSIANINDSLETLLRLRLMGFALSIDDFGTGYSSLAQLNSIPFTELKIDQSFIQGAKTDESKRAIVESCAELGKKLNLIVVAEGVEDPEDLTLANSIDCDLLQGYLYSKPMPFKETEEYIKKYQS